MTPTLGFYNLTVPTAQQQLQNDGLLALGLATVALSPHWATGNIVAYNANNLTLTSPGQLKAPFRGILQGAFAPARSFLAGAVAKGDTTFNVLTNDGAKFPAPPAGSSVVLTLSNASETKREFVALTNVNNDTFTVTRGFDGSAAQDFDAGDVVTLRVARNNTSVQFRGADGQPLMMTCAVLRFHPQAALRLERMMALRYEPGVAAPVRPVPHAMVIHNAGFYLTDQVFEADDNLLGNGAFQFSFHDARGLIVDPVYVGAVFADLLAAFPALQPAAVNGAVGDVGGLNNTSVLNLANGTLLHFIDPHGATFQPVTGGGLVVGTGNQTTPVPLTGLVALPQGQSIQPATQNGPVRFGWATNGLLSTTNLTPPAMPQNANITVGREFFRVCAMDTVWAVRGNRTTQNVRGVQGDDGRIDDPAFLPDVRDQVTIDYLVDGPDTLAEINRVMAPAPQKMTMAVSMVLDESLLTPAQKGPNAHWPAFPAPAAAVPLPPNQPAQILPTLPANSVTAAFSTAVAADVVVTLTGIAPFDSHVRIYPQQFVVIEAIGSDPSFVRGDGGANITGAGAVDVLLLNPFNLAAGENPPNPAQLTLDIVVTTRGGAKRMYGAVAVNVTGQKAPPVSPFAGPPPLIPATQQLEGIGPSPLFGVPVPVPPPAPPNTGGFLQLLLSFIADTMPRQANRLPTQARLETIAVSGVGPNNAPLAWDAVISGGRWGAESRSAQHDLGNPGNPAGPDVHAPGVRVNGALAYDAANVALRRAEPMIPWPGVVLNFPGWVVLSMGDNFDPPPIAADATTTSTGGLLRTIACACESSLLAERTIPTDAQLNQETYIDQFLGDLGLNPNTVNFPIQNDPRLRKEVRREFYISKHGLRDAQWSLLRAIREARELIYIESPQFARTALPAQGQQLANYEVDLVEEIAQRLAVTPDASNLKVIVCTPRISDFMPQFKSWAHQHYTSRTEAVTRLLSAARDRVVVFHPVGYPGRPSLIRTTSVIVDDVWSLVGATHFRRRGMTFDGSVAVASFDRQMENGYSKKVRNYRQALMAAKLHVPAPVGNLAPLADWIRLGRPESSFALVQDLLAQGGLGRVESLWPGPKENVLSLDPKVADPDGSVTDNYIAMTTFGGVLNEAGN